MGDNWDDDDDWETAADTVANEDKFAGEDEAPAAAWDAPPAPQVGPHRRIPCILYFLLYCLGLRQRILAVVLACLLCGYALLRSGVDSCVRLSSTV